MDQALPNVKVVRCYFDESFEPHLPAMTLRWDTPGQEPAERLWELPAGFHVLGPAPERFGFQVRRLDSNYYSLRLLWDQTCLSWPSVSRLQLMSCSLAPLLAALGTDLWSLLDQPIYSAKRARPRAA
jgi:hypothetical protein